MLTAAHLIFVQANDCGLRNLCAFLERKRHKQPFLARGLGFGGCFFHP
jgi:hypothetical protein